MNETLQQVLAELQMIRERADKATGGKWIHVGTQPDEIGTEVIVSGEYANQGEPDIVIEVCSMDGEQDADFIAHAREDVPKLCDALQEAADENKRLNEWNSTHRRSNEDLVDEVMRLRNALEKLISCYDNTEDIRLSTVVELARKALEGGST